MKRLSSDRLSPILVKELRQGIRSKLFLGAFLVIQVLLFLYGATLLMSDDFRAAASWELAFFWSALTLPLLVLVPAMASQGIEKEIRGHTLDLLLLTRMTSHRIVLGKWASVIVQSTLLVTSALPYVVLRYFLGGIDVWNELLALAYLVLASAFLAGITMGFWSTKISKLIKSGIVLVFFWLGPTTLVMLISYRRGMGGAGFGMTIWIYAFIVMLMMLALAAGRIGPPAENHSTPIRILAFSAVIAGLTIRGSSSVETLSATFAVIILLPSVIGALMEKVLDVPRLYAPFVRRKGVALWASLPWSPGWPGGVAFSCLVLTLAPWFPVWSGEFRPPVFVAATATLLFPAALLQAFLRPERRKPGFYLLALILLTTPLYVWGAARAFDYSTMYNAVEYALGLFPPAALILELSGPSGITSNAATIEGLLVVLWSLFVLARAARAEWRRMASLGRGETSPAPPVPTVASVVEGSVS